MIEVTIGFGVIGYLKKIINNIPVRTGGNDLVGFALVIAHYCDTVVIINVH